MSIEEDIEAGIVAVTPEDEAAYRESVGLPPVPPEGLASPAVVVRPRGGLRRGVTSSGAVEGHGVVVTGTDGNAASLMRAPTPAERLMAKSRRLKRKGKHGAPWQIAARAKAVRRREVEART